MSFINISDPKKRDEIVKSYLAIKKGIQQRNINKKLGTMAQAEYREKMFEPITKSNIQAATEISKDLVPIRKELEQFNQEIAFGLAAPDPKKMLPTPDIFSPTRRRSLPSTPSKQVMGKIPVDYLRQALSCKKDNDPVFGMYNENRFQTYQNRL